MAHYPVNLLHVKHVRFASSTREFFHFVWTRGGGQYRLYSANKRSLTGPGSFGGELGSDRALFTVPGSCPLCPHPTWPRDLFNRRPRPTLCRGNLALMAPFGPPGLGGLRGPSWHPLPSWPGRLAWTLEAPVAASLVASVVPRGPCAQNCVWSIV